MENHWAFDVLSQLGEMFQCLIPAGAPDFFLGKPMDSMRPLFDRAML